ncbi:hypothetical protein T552_01564 [Pneumocystis carinii B80]|uniref:Uncharacterized protein n=1 Tax=Pneumocystis carinii (strain B80) TaxID=1408658 RepID=A0A0W4ZKQ0_PNEC8|nr:hypothetical protein T552_01564 [Pneumocystis carinii B80]KTW28936.1 hypothetical protein T552_01564 [Pneumocystis carinii B80]
MRASQHKYFKWTPRTVLVSLVLGIFVPGCIGYIALMTERQGNKGQVDGGPYLSVYIELNENA